MIKAQYPGTEAFSRLARGISFTFLLACSGSVSADGLHHIGTFEWPSESFVGLSGLEIQPDGMSFTAISDRGWFLTGDFTRDHESISDIKLTQLLPILGLDGLPVTARRTGDWSDAEGLAMAPDGSYWISFERWAHVSRFEAPDEPAQWIKDHPSFSEFADNRQLEALALHPDGTLYTFPEQTLGEGFPIYRLEDDTWTIGGHIPKQNGFALVGADFDTDGQLYLLERKLLFGLWWQSRVRRLQIDDPDDGEVLWTSRWDEYNNLEGIAVWHDANGARLTLVSDNNGQKGEPTQFVEFRISPSQSPN